MATGRVPTTANSPLTAKGDLFGYSTTQARVPVGNDGESLVADSSQAVGLRYQAPYSQQPVLNSAFQIWQRGTTFANSGTAVYGADRWGSYRGGYASGSTVSRQATGDTTNLPNIQYCARVQRDSGNTSTASVVLAQAFESINSIPFAGKTVTISFYARKGANYSPTSSLLVTQLYYGTGTDQTPWAGFTGGAQAIDVTSTLTTTWQRFQYTGTVPATATQLAIQFPMNPTGTAGAADYFEVTGVQLELGSVATPFHTYAGTIQGELAACQRYYFRYTTTANYGNLAPVAGIGQSTTVAKFSFAPPVPMRVNASSLDYSTLILYDTSNTPAITAAAISSESTKDLIGINFTVASGLTQFRPYFVLSSNSTAAYLGASAEL